MNSAHSSKSNIENEPSPSTSTNNENETSPNHTHEIMKMKQVLLQVDMNIAFSTPWGTQFYNFNYNF